MLYLCPKKLIPGQPVYRHKYMKTRNLLITAALFGMCALMNSALAVPPPPTSTPPTPTPSTPTGIPLDGGVFLLAAAGAAYGVKNIYSRRKKSK